MTFWRCDSIAIFEGKIAQLCALVKPTILSLPSQILELCISNAIFSYYVCKKFRFTGTLKKISQQIEEKKFNSLRSS